MTPKPKPLAVTSERPDYTGTWYQMLFRSLATRISGRLVHTRITPNQITGVATLLYIVPAYLFFQESVLLNVLGVLCIYLINVLDKVDGQLARAKRMTSKRGIFLDGILHNVGILAVYLPLGLRWYLGHGDTEVLIAAFASVTLLLLTGFNYLNRAYLIETNPSSEKNKLGVSVELQQKRTLVTVYSLPNQHFPELLIIAFITHQVPLLLYFSVVYNALTFVLYAVLLSRFDP